MTETIDPRTEMCFRMKPNDKMMCGWSGKVRDTNHLDFIGFTDWECPRCRRWSVTEPQGISKGQQTN